MSTAPELNAIAAFLKERDEAGLTPDEMDDEERLESAKEILAALSASPSGEAVALGEDEMPERIWAGDFDEQGFGHCVRGMQGGLYSEYVRVDLASPRAVTEAMVEALRDAKFAIEATTVCLNSWNGGRGAPCNTAGILERIDSALAAAAPEGGSQP